VFASTSFPLVRITNPPNGAVYQAHVNIPLYAYAADPLVGIATVEFSADGSPIGSAHPVNALPPPLPPGPIQPPILIVKPTNYWELLWTNPSLATNITVFRFGATNDDLVVNYGIGGTATNGLNYAALPGVVTIPAGQRQAGISIIPLDDGPSDRNSTVVLTLEVGTNYEVGLPAAAAAIILDSQSPRAATGLLPGNRFHLCASGPDGAWYHVEESPDLIHWTAICTNQVVNGGIDFVDPDEAGQAACFYRTVPESGPPH
jgi:hypothetical protein